MGVCCRCASSAMCWTRTVRCWASCQSSTASHVTCVPLWPQTRAHGSNGMALRQVHRQQLGQPAPQPAFQLQTPQPVACVMWLARLEQQAAEAGRNMAKTQRWCCSSDRAEVFRSWSIQPASHVPRPRLDLCEHGGSWLVLLSLHCGTHRQTDSIGLALSSPTCNSSVHRAV